MERTRSLGLIAAALLMALGGRAQNLVPNGSFEEYTECPTSFGYWANVLGWISPFTASADYFNACTQNLACSVPFNDFGYQAASDGQAYMGVCTYVNMGMFREVIATELIEPLQPGFPVYCSYKVSPGGFGSNAGNSATWSAKGPDLNFFTQLPETSQPWLFSGWAAYLFPNSAAIEMLGPLNDTSAWTTVSGVYVPDSAYTWMAIMNFYENDLSLPVVQDPTGISDVAYAYIDDVCVSYDSTFCDLAQGLVESKASTPRAYPMPFSDRLHVNWAVHDRVQVSSYELLDMRGATIRSGVPLTFGAELRVELAGLPSGYYILQMNLAKGGKVSIPALCVAP